MREAVPAVLLAFALLAGCAAKAPPAAVADDQAMLHGVVVTGAIVPIAGANVSVAPGGLFATTDAAGTFALGPLAPGAYQVTAKARGYADRTTTIQVATGPNKVANLVLDAVATDVPYFELDHFSAFIQCSYSQNFGGVVGGDFSCLGITDLVAGVKVDSDVDTFPVHVNSGGFKGLLFEMVWQAQSTGPNYGGYLRDPVNVGQVGGVGLEKQYWAGGGASPLRAWILQGVENDLAYKGDVFHPDTNVSADYEILVGGITDESKPADVAVTLNQKLDLFVTLFYNALGDQSYSVLTQ
jgi:hypothetical protein